MPSRSLRSASEALLREPSVKDIRRAAKKDLFPTETSKTKLKQYVLTTPVSTRADGSYISNLVSASHSRRSIRDVSPSPKQLYFNVSAFGKEFHLRLRPNARLIAPGAMVEWYEDSAGARNVTDGASLGQTKTITERIWKKESLWTDCAYVGDVVDIPGASVAVSNCDGLKKEGVG
ncbi:A disintegrin and metalloproteinase with thrombospondin motifs 3 [Varanus komodoensis]|nr:A disintegrin and metalloproteinase with thrombospondin motifs 3 [Varanus komodoensis]